MSTLSDVLLWAQRVLSRAGQPPHQILELTIDATLEQAQEAFHKIARAAHPDLHRRALSAEDFETLERAYARAAGAYQDFKSQRVQTTRMRPIKDVPMPIPGVTRERLPTPPGTPPVAAAPGEQMNAKAKLYFQKVELALNRGDLRGAILQMKMAIAADPSSTFLRTALTEIEAELKK